MTGTTMGDSVLDLQLAYMISGEASSRSTPQLFWAVDRLWHDRAQIDEHAQANRSDATQHISRELDSRGVAVRDPRAPKSYPGSCPN